MVNRPLSPDIISDLRSWPSPIVGTRIKKGRRAIEIRFPDGLFEQIKSEAALRGWSFSRMVRHLCEASIDGIE